MRYRFAILAPVFLATTIATTAQGAPADLAKFYAGGFASLDGGQATAFALPANSETGSAAFTGTLVGGFFGHNYQNGAFVLGVEAAYSTGSLHDAGNPDAAITSMIDIKLHAGYAVGQSGMVYAVGGVAYAHQQAGAAFIDSNGISYGLGAQYMLTDNWFVAAEYLQRSLRGISSDGARRVEYTLPSAQIRLGYNF